MVLWNWMLMKSCSRSKQEDPSMSITRLRDRMRGSYLMGRRRDREISCSRLIGRGNISSALIME